MSGLGRAPAAAAAPPFVSLATDLLAVIGPDGCFKRLAPGFAQTFGYTLAELLEQPFITFVHRADRAATQASLDKLFQREPTLGLENLFRCKDGSYRRLAWTAMPTPEGLLYAAARDITEYWQPESERVPSQVREQAAALAQKEGLLLTVCHDVQQPLTIMLVQTQLLERQLARGEMPHQERFETHLAYISAAARRMRDMTRDLLDSSLQQSGRGVALRLAQVDLVALVRQAVNEHRLISDLHQFLVDAAVPTLEAVVDETRVYRVLANLLTNAIKYSPQGGPVRVSIGTGAWDSPTAGSAELVVQDQGVGIPREDLPHIFDRFHRGANVVGRFVGMGLGLASARELVEMHGGTISAESTSGQGSTFVVRLPLTPPANAPGLSEN